VINPLVPVSTDAARVPTGHGGGGGVRDKGLLWVYNQAMRIGDGARLTAETALLRARRPDIDVRVIEPSGSDAVLFMYSSMNYSARRAILEDAYKSVRARRRSPTPARGALASSTPREGALALDVCAARCVIVDASRARRLGDATFIAWRSPRPPRWS
jgi:hypothetical protein